MRPAWRCPALYAVHAELLAERVSWELLPHQATPAAVTHPSAAEMMHEHPALLSPVSACEACEAVLQHLGGSGGEGSADGGQGCSQQCPAHVSWLLVMQCDQKPAWHSSLCTTEGYKKNASTASTHLKKLS